MKQFIIAALLSLVTSIGIYAQCSDADRKKLEEFDKAWGDAAVRGDRAALANIYADDFVNVSATGTQTKAQVIDAQVKQAEADRANPQSAVKVGHDHYVITCTPLTATITHRNVITSTKDGKQITEYSRSIHYLEKRGGHWQAVSSTGHGLTDAGVLTYMEQEWNDADIKHDAAWFEYNYAEDLTDISSRTGAISTKSEDIQDLKAPKAVMEWAELSGIHVRVEGNAGVVTGINHVKGHDDKGTAFDRTVSFTDTFVKRDGRWQVWATQGTEVKK
jgi:ketosteroid isomerase-like protein